MPFDDLDFMAAILKLICQETKNLHFFSAGFNHCFISVVRVGLEDKI
jgi:hypothetical protein